MSLAEQINIDIKNAMKAKEREKLAALRDIKSKLMLEATSGNGGLDEAKENKIILKLHKQRIESHQLYIEQGREDLANDEMFQAKIIEEYLPKMLSEEEVKQKVIEVIKQLGATGPQDMGKVMGTLTKELAGKADGKQVASIVQQELRK